MKEEFKAYRLRLIADAVEKVNAERELQEKLSDDFSLEELTDEN